MKFISDVTFSTRSTPTFPNVNLTKTTKNVPIVWNVMEKWLQ